MDFIQKAYVECYGLKEYFPTLIQPYHLFSSSNDPKPVYHSLSLETYINNERKPKRIPTIIEEARELKALTDIFKKALETKELDMLKLKDIYFNYYHPEQVSQGIVLPSTNIIKDDALFINDNFYESNDKFAANSPFCRGCIKVSKK